MSAQAVYQIFLFFFVFSTALQLWLSLRQSRALLRHAPKCRTILPLR